MPTFSPVKIRRNVFGMFSPDAYRGCHVFKVKDLATAALERTSAGLPKLERALTSTADFSGACAYDESATQTGILFGRTTRPTDLLFEILRTGYRL